MLQEKRFTLRINVEQSPHLIIIGEMQAMTGVVPVIGHIEIDGARFDIRTRPLKPIMMRYRFLFGMLPGQRIFRNIGLNRIMMVGIGYQIVI